MFRKDRLQIFGLILLPSVFSLVMTSLLVGVVLAIALWSYSSQTGLLYTYLFGANASPAIINHFRDSLHLLVQDVLGNNILNRILFFVFWGCIGLIVYVLIYSLSAPLSSLLHYQTEKHYKNVNPERFTREAVQRGILRFSAVVGWGIYWLFFLKYLLPYTVLSSQIALSYLHGLSSLLYGLLALVLLGAGIHLHLVFWRLAWLRVRLFGDDDQLLARLDDQHTAQA